MRAQNLTLFLYFPQLIAAEKFWGKRLLVKTTFLLFFSTKYKVECNQNYATRKVRESTVPYNDERVDLLNGVKGSVQVEARLITVLSCCFTLQGYIIGEHPRKEHCSFANQK